MNKGLDLLADYVFYSKYSQPKEDGTLETWDESVDRIYDMHKVFLKQRYEDRPMDYLYVKNWLDSTAKLEKEKKILSSQRARQFASPNPSEGILKSHLCIYNCAFSIVDRVEFFKELLYLSISGVGTGYSLHRGHIEKLPEIKPIEVVDTIYTIGDSKEGWAEAIGVLFEGIFNTGKIPKFDYSAIRPKGSLIAGKWKAPGAEPLKNAIEKILKVAKANEGQKPKSIVLYTFACLIADCVISGGIRRSATLTLFDVDDEDMLKAKTGDWYIDHPEYARSNNSICLAYGQELGYKEQKAIFEHIKEYGEPGFVRVPSYDYGFNPLDLLAA